MTIGFAVTLGIARTACSLRERFATFHDIGGTLGARSPQRCRSCRRACAPHGFVARRLRPPFLLVRTSGACLRSAGCPAEFQY
ncbi:hypothetical protein CO709_15125 [Burkholderia thailandensis]|uniref:hypothetical protein n=1 Tax=Burkholderia humptydooensis TaxID=430531 RepID=UPI0003A56C70|nr:hypothetical protein [Burkholderia humptydooensis]ATF34635.1 hypothetical protein CO709_15125 [Burkholderia thailandensis]KST75209.1 hypothetical protein WS76_14300 [Burkholderia humptydooensis]